MENLHMLLISWSIIITLVLITSAIWMIFLLNKKIKQFKNDIVSIEIILGDVKDKLKEFFHDFNNLIKKIDKKIDEYDIDYKDTIISCKDAKHYIEIMEKKYSEEELKEKLNESLTPKKDDYITMSEMENYKNEKSK